VPVGLVGIAVTAGLPGCLQSNFAATVNAAPQYIGQRSLQAFHQSQLPQQLVRMKLSGLFPGWWYWEYHLAVRGLSTKS